MRYLPYGPEGNQLFGLLERLNVDCVLDVGAFTGTYGRMLRELGYRGRIVSFEPATENFNALKREAKGDTAWDIRRVALGSRPGKMQLRLTRSSGSNSLLVPNRYAMEEMPRTFTPRALELVDVTRVDDVFDEVVGPARSVFLKVDAQGYDLEVIRGAVASLGLVAALQVELSLQQTYEGQPGYLEVLAELADHGFTPAQLYATYRDSTGRIAECDCVLLR